MSGSLLLLLVATACALVARGAAQTTLLSPGAAFVPSAPVNGVITVSGNTTGSLGNLCTSQAGLVTALRSIASNQDTAGLNLTIPSALNTPAGLQQVALVSTYSYSYGLQDRSFLNERREELP